MCPKRRPTFFPGRCAHARIQVFLSVWGFRQKGKIIKYGGAVDRRFWRLLLLRKHPWCVARPCGLLPRSGRLFRSLLQWYHCCDMECISRHGKHDVSTLVFVSESLSPFLSLILKPSTPLLLYVCLAVPVGAYFMFLDQSLTENIQCYQNI